MRLPEESSVSEAIMDFLLPATDRIGYAKCCHVEENRCQKTVQVRYGGIRRSSTSKNYAVKSNFR